MSATGRVGFDKKRLLASSSVFLSVSPSPCDVVITMPRHTPEQHVMNLLHRLTDATSGLSFRLLHNPGTQEFSIHVSAHDLRVLLSAAKQQQGFCSADLQLQQTSGDDEGICTEQRQWLVQKMLWSVTASEGGECFGAVHLLGGESLVPVLQSRQFINQVFPLHSPHVLRIFQKTWISAWTSYQPLDDIKQYFGVKIALYFAFIGFYTFSLLLPSVSGVCVWLFTREGELGADIAFLMYSVFNSAWTSFFLSAWRRRSAELTYRWGTLDMGSDLMQAPRPLYRGKPGVSPVTGRMEITYSQWKRAMILYLFTMPCTFICLCIVFITVLWLQQFQDYIESEINDKSFHWLFAFFPRIVLAVALSVLDECYRKVAIWLNNLENHRLETEFENHLTLKLVVFQCGTAFFAPLYLAFHDQDMTKLGHLLGTLLITRQIVGNIKEIISPFVYGTAKIYHAGYQMTERFSPASIEALNQQMRSHFKEQMDSVRKRIRSSSGRTSKGSPSRADEEFNTQSSTPRTSESESDTGELHPTLTQAEVEASMKPYGSPHEDYLEMLIQFGYVTMFSSIFPFAGLCALLNNVIEIRSDAFKLCRTFQKPFGSRVCGTGVWETLFETMSVIATVLNSALLVTSGAMRRLFPSLQYSTLIILVVCVEHVVLAIKVLMTMALPSTPAWVDTARAREEYKRRKFASKTPDTTPFVESKAS